MITVNSNSTSIFSVQTFTSAPCLDDLSRLPMNLKHVHPHASRLQAPMKPSQNEALLVYVVSRTIA